MSVGNRTQAETASSRGYTLIDVLEPENMAAAWKKVKANNGKPGIDGMEVGDFPEARELDGWLRRRMRLYYWKQWGRSRTRRRKLLKLGIGRHEVHKASRSRKGHWRMSANSLVSRALTNDWLAEQGVPSLEKQWVSPDWWESRLLAPPRSYSTVEGPQIAV